MKKMFLLTFLSAAFCLGGTEKMMLGELVWPSGETNSCVVYVMSGNQNKDDLFYKVDYSRNEKILSMVFKDSGSLGDTIIATDPTGEKTLLGSSKDDKFSGCLLYEEKEKPDENEKQPENRKTDFSKIKIYRYAGDVRFHEGEKKVQVKAVISGENGDKIRLILLVENGKDSFYARTFYGGIKGNIFATTESGIKEPLKRSLLRGTISDEEIYASIGKPLESNLVFFKLKSAGHSGSFSK